MCRIFFHLVQIKILADMIRKHQVVLIVDDEPDIVDLFFPIN